MTPLKPHESELIDKLIELGTSNALIRDISSVLPFIPLDGWFTSISLRKRMYPDKGFTRKELSKVSQALSSIYHRTQLLNRQEKRKLYFHHVHKRHISHWAYQLNFDYIRSIIPNPDEVAAIEEKANRILTENPE